MSKRTPGTDNRILRDPRVDILTVACDLKYEEAQASRVLRTIDGVSVPYLSLEDLIRSKQTNRHQDLADIEVLRGIQRDRKKPD